MVLQLRKHNNHTSSRAHQLVRQANKLLHWVDRAPSACSSTCFDIDDNGRDDNCSCFFDELGRCNGLSCSHDVSRWTSCTRMLRSRRDIENVDKQSVQLIVLVSMLPTVPGMLVLVEYSNDEIRPMVATALQHFLHSTG